MKLRVNLAGRRFGRLVAVEPTGDRYGDGSVLWRSRCDCGGENVSPAKVLIRGDTRSCGCLQDESRIARKTTHGYSETALYRRWRNIINRCENPRVPSFRDYGARGIQVCKQWHHFENFIADMGEPPPGTEIDRIDNEGPYCPENCRWVTRAVNARKKRNSVILTIMGVTKPLIEWADLCGVKPHTAYARHRKGWNVERVLEVDIAHI